MAAPRKFLSKLRTPLINIYRDYQAVAKDIAKQCYSRPSKPIIICAFAGLLGYIYHRNPDEESFDEELQSAGNSLLLLSRLTRNPTSESHVDRLLWLRNEHLLKHYSLGLFSLIVREDVNELCDNYNYSCEYLKSGVWTFYDKIEDFGVMNKWLILQNKMIDYDVNTALD